jgi:hypothetical protein
MVSSKNNHKVKNMSLHARDTFANGSLTPKGKTMQPQPQAHRSLKDICRERELLAEKEGVKLGNSHYRAVPLYEGYVPKYLGVQSNHETYN